MRHSTSKFTFAKTNKRFIGEISELGYNVFGQIYLDACDRGIVLVSEKTGAESKWVEDRQLMAGWAVGSVVPTRRNLRA